MTALALAKLGQAHLIPVYMVSVSSFIILVFTVLRSNGILFGSRDYEMLSSLPVQAKEIISSKFGFLYLLNFLMGILFILPAGIVWQIYDSHHLIFFFMYLLSAVFVPFVPMCMASLIGVLITAVSSKFRRKNIFSLIFSFAILGGLLGIGIYSMQTGSSGENLGVILMEQVSSLYPLSTWFYYTDSISLVGNVGFWFLSVLVFFIFVKIVERRYATEFLRSAMSCCIRWRKNQPQETFCIFSYVSKRDRTLFQFLPLGTEYRSGCCSSLCS